MKAKMYSTSIQDEAEAKIPAAIIDVSRSLGWNIFGIYETVAVAIKKHKRQNRRCTMVDVKKLKEMTAKAIYDGQEKARRLQEAAIKKEIRKKFDDELKASRIIDKIPIRAETEAAEGRNHCIVMSIKFEDYSRPHDANDWRVCDPKWLNGAAKLVWEYCVKAELNPTIEDWHDGMGMDSGHNIVIHW